MTILKCETIEIELPYSKAKIKIKKRFTYGAILDFRENTAEDKKDSNIELARTLIYDWNFTDEAGKKLPITKENIKKLDNEDGNFLLAKVNETITEKKTSN